jgi:hypothetical protein
MYTIRTPDLHNRLSRFRSSLAASRVLYYRPTFRLWTRVVMSGALWGSVCL